MYGDRTSESQGIAGIIDYLLGVHKRSERVATTVAGSTFGFNIELDRRQRLRVKSWIDNRGSDGVAKLDQGY